jgi:nucleoside-diphosphate-sugar epimerase
MKVFVAGATGVLGRRAVGNLVAAGHEVTAVARTPAKATSLSDAGATPVGVDLFDPAAVTAAVAGHEVVANLATHIPPVSRAALPGAWADNSRLRSVASQHLVDGALAGGATTYLQESITFPYPDGGDRWLDEDVPFVPVRFVTSVLEAERAAARFTAAGHVGVVLRFSAFYGPDSHHTVSLVRMAQRKLAFQPGRPDAYLSSIHTDDAAAAVVAALSVGAGSYNVTDDEPLTRRDFDAIVANTLGLSKLRRPPALVTRLGGSQVGLLARSQRVSNARLRAASTWAPAHPSAREGLPGVIAAIVTNPA